MSEHAIVSGHKMNSDGAAVSDLEKKLFKGLFRKWYISINLEANNLNKKSDDNLSKIYALILKFEKGNIQNLNLRQNETNNTYADCKQI